MQCTISRYAYEAPVESYTTQAHPQDNKMAMMLTVAETMKTMMTSVMEMVMESGTMRLAMIISGIIFTQTSILNFVYFLGGIQGLLG